MSFDAKCATRAIDLDVDACESCCATEDLCLGEDEGSGDDVFLCREHCYHGSCDRDAGGGA